MIGRIFVQREVRSPVVIVPEIGLEGPAEAGLVEDDGVVQAFAPQGSGIATWTRPWYPGIQVLSAAHWRS